MTDPAHTAIALPQPRLLMPPTDLSAMFADLFDDWETPEPREEPPIPVEDTATPVIVVEADPPVIVVIEPTPSPVLIEYPWRDMLPCGHSNWYGATRIAEAVTRGFCCPGGEQGRIRDRKLWCPIPDSHRFDPSKTGFRGYCTDSNGRYIGGVTNNCLEADPGNPCKGHQKITHKPVEDPTQDVDPVIKKPKRRSSGPR